MTLTAIYWEKFSYFQAECSIYFSLEYQLTKCRLGGDDSYHLKVSIRSIMKGVETFMSILFH